MKRILGKILIVLGILIVSITIYINYTTKKSNDDLITKYEKVITTPKSDKQPEKIPENIIAILEIPKIGLKVAVGEGTDKETLKLAVGHFTETKLPGEIGNFAVAGHSAYSYNKFFAKLDQVKNGDEIKVKTIQGEYTYKVTETEVVTPDKVEVLDSIENKKTITLITCTPRFTGTHRLVIKGEI